MSHASDSGEKKDSGDKKDSVLEKEVLAALKKFPSIGITTVGNSGAGKSFLMNALLQDEKFIHAFQPSAVTTKTEWISVKVKNSDFLVFNIPGLIEAESENVERNKRELKTAFDSCAACIVLFVLTEVGGRVSAQDFTAYKAIEKAYELKQKSVGFLFNRLPKSRYSNPNYEIEVLAMIKTRLKWETTPAVAFIDALDTSMTPSSSGYRAAMDSVREQILTVIYTLVPDEYKEKEPIRLLEDEIAHLIKQQAKLNADFGTRLGQKDAELQQIMADLKAERAKPKEIIRETIEHHYHERGGCSLS